MKNKSIFFRLSQWFCNVFLILLVSLSFQVKAFFSPLDYLQLKRPSQYQHNHKSNLEWRHFSAKSSPKYTRMETQTFLFDIFKSFTGGGGSPSGSKGKFPILYDCYFPKSKTSKTASWQILDQVSMATNNALKDGLTQMEVIFPPVPNLEELAFGTALNKEYLEEVSDRLNIENYVVKKDPIFYSTLDFANMMAGKLTKVKANSKMLLINPSQGNKIPELNLKAIEYTSLNSKDLLDSVNGIATGKSIGIIINPGVDMHWKKAQAIHKAHQQQDKLPILALNAPFSLRYDVGMGGPWEPIFCMKRISKGWLYRSYPGNFEIYLETVNPGELIKVHEFPMGWKASLKEASNICREESDKRGYMFFNDRYMGGKL